MTKILIDEVVVRQALEYLQDNQHLIADNERHAYVMEYNAFIERFEQTIAGAEQPAPSQPLTDEQIQKLAHVYDNTAPWTLMGFARAIEAAHGITKGNT